MATDASYPHSILMPAQVPARVMDAVVPAASHKLLVLESVRGIAALAVFNWHFIELFALQAWRAHPHLSSPGLVIALALAQETPFDAFFNPELAVRTFFVLSGFVLSWRYFTEHKDEIVRAAAIKRTLRLAIPIWASLIIAFIVLRETSSYTDVLQLPPLFDKLRLQMDVQYAPTWWELFKQSVKVLFFGTDGHTFNRALWTMRHELWGSYVVFGLLLLFGSARHRWALYLAGVLIAVLVSQIFVVDFLLGMALCDVTTRFQNEPLVTRSFRRWATLSAATGLAFMIYGWNPLLARGWGAVDLFQVTPALAAASIVFGALYSPWLQSLLNFKPFVVLGRLSFALYLLHLSVIYAVGAWIFKSEFNASGDYSRSLIISYFASIGALLAAAALFTKFVDEPALALTRRLTNSFLPRTRHITR